MVAWSDKWEVNWTNSGAAYCRAELVVGKLQLHLFRRQLERVSSCPSSISHSDQVTSVNEVESSHKIPSMPNHSLQSVQSIDASVV